MFDSLNLKQPLLHIISFTVDETKNISDSTKRWVVILTFGVIVIVGLIPLSKFFIKSFFSEYTFWVNAPTHSFLEAFYALISIIIGLILLLEYHSSGKAKSLFLTFAFFSMGILDFFHAFSEYCHNLFVWFHSSGAFFGSLFFFLSLLIGEKNNDDNNSHTLLKRKFYILLGVTLIVAFALLSIRFYYLIPNALVIPLPHHTPVTMARGQFSYAIYGLNFLSSIFFLIAGLTFLRGFLHSNDVIYQIFATATLLLFGSELSFVFSKLWDPLWWYWHFIKVLIATGLLLGLVYGFVQTLFRLNESRAKLTELLETIKKKNVEIMDAYERLKETQKRLRESEKLASMGKMAAALAHEIRNPLGAITNSIEVLKRYGSYSSDELELIYIVENELERLSKLTEDFLSFSRSFRLRKSETDIHSILEEVLSLLHLDGTKRSGVKVVKSFDPEVPTLLVDRDYIKQALLNIVLNSIEAMPEGGDLIISTRYKSIENEVEVAVKDSGVGMSPETLSRAFEPFFTTKERGLGIGLNITHKIVHDHGGYITISSSIGEGTTVTLCLPVISEKSLLKDVQESTMKNSPPYDREKGHD